MGLISGAMCDGCGRQALSDGHMGINSILVQLRELGWSVSKVKGEPHGVRCPECRLRKQRKLKNGGEK